MSHDDHRLETDDQARVDALLEHGFAPSAGPDADPDAGPVAGLLALLDTPIAGEQRAVLSDLTFLRVIRANEEPEAVLSQADAEALDSWIMAGSDAARTELPLRERAWRHERLAALATTPGPAFDGRAERVERTLAMVQEAAEADADRMRIEHRRGRAGLGGVRLADLVSVAAMLMLVSAIALPVLSNVRASARQAMCYANMGPIASAMGLYAGANAEALPMATAGFGGTWMNVGTTPEQSNSANLYTLVRTDHIPLAELACPGNQHAPTAVVSPAAWDWRSHDELSYSYRIVVPGQNTRWRLFVSDSSGPAGVLVLTDRSPVTLRASRGEPIVPEANSPHHGGAGQHALFNDGSSRWLESPVLGSGDNIWLPRAVERVIHQVRSRLGLIRGNEVPQSVEDAFVGP